MTEYKCGSAETCEYGDMCNLPYDIGGCSHFKKKEPLTNEEWLRSASTEELAEWLARKLDYCANMDCENCPVEKECNDGINDYSESELWEKWLKEKHTDGNT